MADPSNKCRSGGRSYVVIPARLASTRLPQKLLLRETGKTVIEHTYRSACGAKKPVGVCVATDSRQIAAEVRRFGGEARITSASCASGTDRVAEVAAELPDFDIVVNVQGDEPEIEPSAIDRVVGLLESDSEAVMSTLATPIRERALLDDPACVKVVSDSAGRAMYFSRSAIPHARDFDSQLLERTPAVYLQHLGLYAYRREFLLELASMPPTRLEKLESLEQLRVLESGRAILVGVVERAAVGIDTRADYDAFVARMRAA